MLIFRHKSYTFIFQLLTIDDTSWFKVWSAIERFVLTFLNFKIMAKGKTLKTPKVDLKAKKQEKIKMKLEAKQTRKRK